MGAKLASVGGWRRSRKCRCYAHVQHESILLLGSRTTGEAERCYGEETMILGFNTLCRWYMPQVVLLYSALLFYQLTFGFPCSLRCCVHSSLLHVQVEVAGSESFSIRVRTSIECEWYTSLTEGFAF